MRLNRISGGEMRRCDRLSLGALANKPRENRVSDRTIETLTFAYSQESAKPR